MTTSLIRRMLGAALVGAAALTGLTAAATPAFAADVNDRVVRVSADNTVLQPDRSASGAAIRAVARIGKADDTPDSQVWKRLRARQPGFFTLVHAPSEDSRPLCIDVEGDSTQAGAALVLRPCDGTDSQAWRQLVSVPPSHLENKQSGLKMEVVGGRLVQNDFPGSDDADRTQRNARQLLFIQPKTFGVGGA
jgi:Ricin-type beta-trefoil lectin domain-like